MAGGLETGSCHYTHNKKSNHTNGCPWCDCFFYGRQRLYRYVTLAPEAVGDVLEGAVLTLAVEALVGGGRLQRSQMLDVRTYLEVVEIGLVDSRRDAEAPAIPRHLELGIGLVDVLCQLVDTNGVCIAAHKGQAGDVGAIALDEGIDSIGIQRHADVVPEVAAVASWAVAWAVGDIDS